MMDETIQASDTDIIVELLAWSQDAGDFHGDRQLADRVLLAAGWRCLPDPGHPAKAKWEFGTNPVYTVWEPYHPHAVNSLEAALGQLPYGWRVCRMTQSDRDGEWEVQAVSRMGGCSTAAHKHLPIAVSIVAIQAWTQDEAKGRVA